MGNGNNIRHGRHCVFVMHVHLAFVTKYRRDVFIKVILDDMRDIFASVCRDFEAELVGFDGEDDYVHLLVNYPPKVAISTVVNSLKGVSTPLWSSSYFAGSCGGAPIGVIQQYIEQQKNTTLKRYAARTATPFALPILALKGEVLRAILIKEALQNLTRRGSFFRVSCAGPLLWPVPIALFFHPAWRSLPRSNRRGRGRAHGRAGKWRSHREN